MLTIIIKKSPAARLFDRMPMPRPRLRQMNVSRKTLAAYSVPAFQRKVSRIK